MKVRIKMVESNKKGIKERKLDFKKEGKAIIILAESRGRYEEREEGGKKRKGKQSNENKHQREISRKEGIRT